MFFLNLDHIRSFTFPQRVADLFVFYDFESSEHDFQRLFSLKNGSETSAHMIQNHLDRKDLLFLEEVFVRPFGKTILNSGVKLKMLN